MNPTTDNKDYYEILDISTDAGLDEIRTQYRRMVRIYHPDRFRNPADKEYAEHKIKEINEAFQVLSDPEKRRSYDRRRTLMDSAGSGKGRPTAQPIATPQTLDFGALAPGTQKVLSFQVDNQGGPVTSFSFAYSEHNSWFQVVQADHQHNGTPFPMDIQVRVDTSSLEPGTDHLGWLDIYLDEISTRVFIKMRVKGEGEGGLRPVTPSSKVMVTLLAVAGLLVLIWIGFALWPTLSPSLTEAESPPAVGGPETPLVIPTYPDRLLFTVYENGQPTLAVAKADGSQQTILPLPGHSGVWAPNGQRLAYLAEKNGTTQIYLAEVNTGAPVQLTDTPGAKSELAWAPDSQRLAFLARDEQGQTLQVLDIPNGVLRILTAPDQGEVRHFSWAPDGTSLAFDLYKDDTSHVFHMEAEGGELHQVVNLSGREPHWSSDGSRLLFVTDRGIYTVDAAHDRDLRRVTVIGDSQQARWSPNGQWIAFVSRFKSEDGDPDLWVTDPLGQHVAPISQHHCIRYAWSPDGQRIGCIDGDLATQPPTLYLWAIGLDGSESIIAEVNEPSISWAR